MCKRWCNMRCQCCWWHQALQSYITLQTAIYLTVTWSFWVCKSHNIQTTLVKIAIYKAFRNFISLRCWVRLISFKHLGSWLSKAVESTSITRQVFAIFTINNLSKLQINFLQYFIPKRRCFFIRLVLHSFFFSNLNILVILIEYPYYIIMQW